MIWSQPVNCTCVEAVAADISSTRDRPHRAQVSKMKTWTCVCCMNGECSYQESESSSGTVPLECAVCPAQPGSLLRTGMHHLCHCAGQPDWCGHCCSLALKAKKNRKREEFAG